MKVIDGTYDFVGDVVRRVRDADLSVGRIRELSRQLAAEPSAEAFVAANPDIASIVEIVLEASAARGRRTQWARDFLLVLGIVLAVYFGIKQVDLASQQVELGREQLRQDTPVAMTTGGLSAAQLRRIIKITENQLDGGGERASSPPKPPSKARAQKRGKTHGVNKKRRRR